MVQDQVEAHGQGGGADVTVTVVAPRSVEPRTFTFKKSLRVGEAAREAATAFGYVGGNPTFAKASTVLDRDKTLVAEGVRDGDRLEIVDAGGGV